MLHTSRRGRTAFVKIFCDDAEDKGKGSTAALVPLMTGGDTPPEAGALLGAAS
jgi:hypothetical protein